MKPCMLISAKILKTIRYVLTDLDDTLTYNGHILSSAIAAMEALQAEGIRVVIVTGRPAGWCDHIARMWPVDGVVGENGAFYFRYDNSERKMVRCYWKSRIDREKDRKRLELLKTQILNQVPGCMVSADQTYREADLAIDFCEDVPKLSLDAVKKIVHLFEQSGATAKISSIHVNGWFGNYDKLSMTQQMFKEIFEVNLDQIKNQVMYFGDSPNDAPLFEFFAHSVAVANLRKFEHLITVKPHWITEKEGGYGFAEMVDYLLAYTAFQK